MGPLVVFTLGALQVGPIEFERPAWLLLAPVLWALTILIGRKSLSGMASGSRRAALVIRLLVILLLTAAIAQPNWTERARNVAVIAVVDVSRSIPLELQTRAEEFLRRAEVKAERGDLIGRVVVGRESYVQFLPGPPGIQGASEQTIDRSGTNLAEGTRLSLAIAPQDRASRILVVSDGNETTGNMLAAAEAARAAGIPMDVLPLQYNHANEVIVERVIAPATARMGENVNLRVLINATAPARGRLTVTANGEPIDLDPDGPGYGQTVVLDRGMNALTVPVQLRTAGAERFDAIFEPEHPSMDAVPENNRASTITFVSGQGRVLVLASESQEYEHLLRALTDARIETDLRPPEAAPGSLVELSAYDAVVMINVPSYALSQQQQEDMRAFVHDIGGGLVMVGGPDTFGAGGWIGSPLADALPIRLDPPQKRQMPKGALVLMMHSCEMPQGNYWGAQTAHAAVRNLSSQDLVGVIEYTWQAGGAGWVHRLAPVGDRASVTRAINALAFGDAPSFEDFMVLAIPDLEKVDAGQKHVIIISDGDPQPPSRGTLQRYINAKISVSTVMVFPHSGPGGMEHQTMFNLAQATGGNFYAITQNNQISSLPDIFIKEAQTIRRALIWEGQPFSPTQIAGSEAMRGIRGVPPIGGYVVAGEREGLSTVSLRGQENDPVLASWQYGLGRAVTFTSDASTRWAPSWVQWAGFRQFWEQHTRWAMRPGGSADVRVMTEEQGDRTRVIVEALSPEGDRLDFVRFRGRVVAPDGTAIPTELRQVGPGRYEGWFPSQQAGPYVINYRYELPAAAGEDGATGQAREGTVQAAVTRPFADEFRALSDNTALLRQVASRTGGRVLSGDPTQVSLWSREGLTMPVSRSPIWLLLALIGIGMFLLDVAVRRVRIDVLAMAAAVQRGFERRKAAGGQHVGTLREARGRAQQAMAERTKRATTVRETAEATAVAVSRATKFEASDEELAKGQKGLDAGVMGTGGAADSRSSAVKPSQQQAPANADEEGISRLLKAKKRARDEME